MNGVSQMDIKVKICGIRNAFDAELALSLGATELGFVLAPSPRRVEPEVVRSIVEALRGSPKLPAFSAVGVFVNERSDTMRDIISYSGLDIAQIHGDESPSDCESFDFPWYRALRIGSAADAERLDHERWGCRRILVDASVKGAGYGGTGASIGTWGTLAARARARGQGKEFFVAGGVKPENVASFVYSFSPDGLDVSSGVEESPGKKSQVKLEAFFGELAKAKAAVSSEEAAYAVR
jgi:phosphoribosylanthranilate isomerase